VAFQGEDRLIEGEHEKKGKWLDPTVPKTGWFCDTMDDAGGDGQLCEMCGCAEVRWLHVLVHDSYDGRIAVGTRCAEELEVDFDRPARRMKAFSLECRIRRELPQREWKRSERGNYYVNSGDFNISTFRKGEGYGLRVRRKATFNDEARLNGDKMYASLEDAKLGRPDALFAARAKLGRENEFENWRALCGRSA
jgi:hypothetical protein